MDGGVRSFTRYPNPPDVPGRGRACLFFSLFAGYKLNGNRAGKSVEGFTARFISDPAGRGCQTFAIVDPVRNCVLVSWIGRDLLKRRFFYRSNKGNVGDREFSVIEKNGTVPYRW